MSKKSAIKFNLFSYCTLILAILFLPAVNPLWAADGYVSDNFEITMRSGPGTNNSIRSMLSSGTPLTILDKQSSWIKVRTPQGEEGWVMQRYVMEQTPKSMRIENLKGKIKGLKSQKNQSQKLTSNLKDKNKKLEGNLEKTQAELKELKDKYEELKTAAGQVMEIKENYKTTQSKLQTSKDKIRSLKNENSKLRSKIRLYWFIAGSSIVFVSAIIGFILGRLQRRKSKKVYF